MSLSAASNPVRLPRKLVLATGNRGKVAEYRTLLEGLPVTLATPDELGIDGQVAETGDSLAANARLKAVALAGRSGEWALGDDSGLEVDALGGAPGHRAARYAGENASDRDRVNFLLAKMVGVPWEKRTARFRCVIALATPAGKVEYCSGECEGIISLAPRGEAGFGYDPIFYFPGLDKTMAELPLEVKNRVSHRGKAARQVAAALERLAVN